MTMPYFIISMAAGSANTLAMVAAIASASAILSFLVRKYPYQTMVLSPNILLATELRLASSLSLPAIRYSNPYLRASFLSSSFAFDRKFLKCALA